MPQIYPDEKFDCLGGIKPVLNISEILDATCRRQVLGQFHPNMADRYHEEVGRLIDAMNTEDQHQEAAELLRKLIDRIELQPVAGDKRLVIDLHGDLAGILSIATQSDKHLVANGLSYINPSRQEGHGSGSAAQMALVAGGRGNRDLPSSQMALVAGVGFEPTTFRL